MYSLSHSLSASLVCQPFGFSSCTYARINTVQSHCGAHKLSAKLAKLEWFVGLGFIFVRCRFNKENENSVIQKYCTVAHRHFMVAAEYCFWQLAHLSQCERVESARWFFIVLFLLWLASHPPYASNVSTHIQSSELQISLHIQYPASTPSLSQFNDYVPCANSRNGSEMKEKSLKKTAKKRKMISNVDRWTTGAQIVVNVGEMYHGYSYLFWTTYALRSPTDERKIIMNFSGMHLCFCCCSLVR